MDIYVDVLFMENLLINYTILFLTKKILKQKILSTRLFVSSIIGSMYIVIMIFCPGIKILYTVISKLLLSVIMVVVAFNPLNVGEFLKYISVFYMVTFVLAGGMFFFIYLDNTGGIVKNGVMLFIKAVLTVGLTLKVIINYIRSSKVWEKLIIPIDIEFDDESVRVNALLDTGANLCDPFSNNPIVVAQFKSIQRLLPSIVQEIFKMTQSKDLNFVIDRVSQSEWFKRFRVIPFSSLGNKNGMLIGFMADNVKVLHKDKRKVFPNVVIAIYEEILTGGNSYEALIGLELYNMLIQ